MNVLVTRPAGQGERLVKVLAELADHVHHQPLMTFEQGPDFADCPSWVEHTGAPLWIFVSGPAVEYFAAALEDPTLMKPDAHYLAVGQSTGEKLARFSGLPVQWPQVQTSEGLLALEALQAEQVASQEVVIVRGVGGRETLAEQLCLRGAKVRYRELYQRVPILNQGNNWYEQWQSMQINCIVVTSVALLTTLFDALSDTARPWLASRHWIVASERIARHAMDLGIPQSLVHDAAGATDQAIAARLQRLTEELK